MVSKETGLYKMLQDNYDVLHTLGHLDVMETMSDWTKDKLGLINFWD